MNETNNQQGRDGIPRARPAKHPIPHIATRVSHCNGISTTSYDRHMTVVRGRTTSRLLSAEKLKSTSEDDYSRTMVVRSRTMS